MRKMNLIKAGRRVPRAFDRKGVGSVGLPPGGGGGLPGSGSLSLQRERKRRAARPQPRGRAAGEQGQRRPASRVPGASQHSAGGTPGPRRKCARPSEDVLRSEQLLSWTAGVRNDRVSIGRSDKRLIKRVEGKALYFRVLTDSVRPRKLGAPECPAEEPPAVLGLLLLAASPSPPRFTRLAGVLTT